MLKIVKATHSQQQDYITKHIAAYGTRPVHPLYGYVAVDGHQCEIEFPNEGRDNPKYEVMAPEGFHFSEGLHSLLCFSMDDLRTRVAQNGLVTCHEGCKEAA